jgi:hypothetical protein
MSPHMVPPHWDFFGKSVDTSMEFEFLQEFVDSLDQLLDEAATRPASRHLPLPDAVAAIASDRAELYSELFPRLLHESFAISSVVFLEHQCRSYVDCLRRALSTPLTLNDLSGTVIERFKTFCEKVCSLDLGISEQAWQDITGLVALRNCLVHSSGFLENSRDRKQIEAFVRRHQTPAILDGNLVFSRLTSRLCLHVLKVFTDSAYGAALERFPAEA